MRIVQFSIRRPVTVTMVFLAIAVFGFVSFRQLPLNLLPDISYPTLTVRTQYEGAAPAEIESLISRPIESAVSVVNNVVRVTSVSKPELSDVIIEFSWKTQMDFAALDVREKLDLVQLPVPAEKPILLRFDPSLDPIMRVSVTGSPRLAVIRYQCDEYVKPDVESIAGVAAVRVSGGLEEEIYVELDEKRMTSLNVSIQEVTNRLAQENINLTGGTLKEGEGKYLVRTLNEFRTVGEIDEVIVAVRNAAPVHLKDIGSAYSGYRERDIITRLNGEESVEIAVFKAADANTVAVAEEVKRRLDALTKEYEGKQNPLRFEVVFDQSRFIQRSIDEVLTTAWQGGLLAIVILFLFLRSIKSTGIIALSIPLSIVATFFLMYSFGVSLNIMSLSGLALGIGMLVDNSIVVLESISRYRNIGHNWREAAEKGATEVGQAVTASTLTTLFVFVPIVFVEGIAGQLFGDLALTVTFSLVASLLVAIVLIPMLASLGAETSGSGEGAVVAKVKDFALRRPYTFLLRGVLRARASSLVVSAALCGVSVWGLTKIGAELIPEISQGEFFLDYRLVPGSPLELTSARLHEVEDEFRSSPGVAQFYTIVGSGNQTGASAIEERENIGQTLVRLQSGLLHEAEDGVVEQLRTKLGDFPALEYKFSKPTLFSFKTPIEVVVQGYNLNALKLHAERVKQRLRQVQGLRDLKASTEGGNPEVHIEFDRRKLAGYGLTVNEAATLIRNKVQGEIPTEFIERDRKIDIRVRVLEDDRRSLSDLRNLALNVAPGGVQSTSRQWRRSISGRARPKFGASAPSGRLSSARIFREETSRGWCQILRQPSGKSTSRLISQFLWPARARRGRLPSRVCSSRCFWQYFWSTW